MILGELGKENTRKVIANAFLAQFLSTTATVDNNRPFLVLLTCKAEYIWLQKYYCRQYFCCHQKIGLAPGGRGVSLSILELQYDDKLANPLKYIQISGLHRLCSCVETCAVQS